MIEALFYKTYIINVTISYNLHIPVLCVKLKMITHRIFML